jgi:hypothetical protein
MKKILSAAVATGLLVAAGSANATIAVGYAPPYNSEALLIAWDDTAGKSVIIDTGIWFNDIFNAANDGDPFAHYLASLNVQPALTAAFGSNLSNVKWNVAQFSRQIDISDPAVGFSHYGTMVTTNNTSPDLSLLTTANITTNISAYRLFFNTTADTSNTSNGAGNNFYVANGTDNAYAGDNDWGSRMNLSLPFDTTQTGSGSLDYYFLGVTADGFDVQMYQVGAWNLHLDTGELSFSPAAEVPVPAAAWLLVSGIAGLGTAARRRKQT